MYFLYECGLFYENVTHLVRLWLNYVQKYHLCSWCWQKNIAICDIWVKLHWYCFWECQRAVLFVIVWYCYFSYLYICICLVWKEASKYCLVCFGYQKVHFCPGLHSSSSSILNTIEYKNTVLFKIAPLSGISIYSNNMSQVHSESLQFIQKVLYA